LIQAVLIFSIIVWILIGFLIIYSYFRTPFLKKHKDSVFKQDAPLVSIIIPARNEENNIEECLESLLKQNYPKIEIVVIDDRSEDRTLELLKSLSAKDQRIKIVEVKELPSGWTGKSHALYEGVKHAQGEWLLFSDADTVHDSRCLAASMNYASKFNLDAVSVEPHFEWNKFFHKLTFPIFCLIVSCIFPIFTINRKDSKRTLSNGQYILIKAKVYESIGGHEKIKDRILEDLALAENVKKSGYSYNLVLGTELEKVRMYRDIKSYWQGWSRILFLALNKNLVSALILYVLFFTISLIPFLVLAFIVVLPQPFLLLKSIVILNAITIFLIIIVNSFIMCIFRINPLYSLLHPISIIAAMAVGGNSIYTTYTKKGIEWKGVRYKV